MERKGACPLDGSWMQDYCATYQSRKESGTLSECEHQHNCGNARSMVESDLNESVSISKKILVEKIPHLFNAKK